MKVFDTSRVENIDRVRTAYIMYEDKAIATITEEYSSISGESDWVIRPLWDVWEWHKKKYGWYYDIAGIDDTLRKDEYVRKFIPSFVTQRTIPDGRSDLPGFLRSIGLPKRDRFEEMCRSHAVCGNDNLYVSRSPDKVINVNDMHCELDIPDWDTSRDGWL